MHAFRFTLEIQNFPSLSTHYMIEQSPFQFWKRKRRERRKGKFEIEKIMWKSRDTIQLYGYHSQLIFQGLIQVNWTRRKHVMQLNTKVV